MAKGTVNKDGIEGGISEMYASGMSIPEISVISGIPKSTVRNRLLNHGVILRNRADAVRLSGSMGKLGGGLRGKRIIFSESHLDNLRRSAIARGEINSRGTRITPSGYVEYTRGEHKGRLVHVVTMEKRIGRHLRDDEIVHHIDGEKTNNSENNLALMTRSGHTRLHRREDRLNVIVEN
jgi:hypothetical protein